MGKLLKPWVLVSVGILFNIGSALITHYFIGINNDQLVKLEQQADHYDTLIESLWRHKTEIDRNQEFLLLLITHNTAENPDNNSLINQYINRQLVKVFQQLEISDELNLSESTIDFDTIISVSAKAIQNLLSSIDETYLDKLEVEEKQTPLKKHNALLYTVAIFLQVTGLILVLARDVRF